MEPLSISRVHRLGVAARSLGRGHAPWRIDLYTAGISNPLTTINIHVTREPESYGGDQTITRLQQPSILPVAARLTAGAVSSIFSLALYCCPFRYNTVFQELPKRNRQSSGERDNTDFAAAHAGAGEPFPPPCR